MRLPWNPTPDGPDKILHHPVQHQQIILTVRFITIPCAVCAYTRGWRTTLEKEMEKEEKKEEEERN